MFLKLLHKTELLSKKWAPLSETRQLQPELTQYIIQLCQKSQIFQKFRPIPRIFPEIWRFWISKTGKFSGKLLVPDFDGTAKFSRKLVLLAQASRIGVLFLAAALRLTVDTQRPSLAIVLELNSIVTIWPSLAIVLELNSIVTIQQHMTTSRFSKTSSFFHGTSFLFEQLLGSGSICRSSSGVIAPSVPSSSSQTGTGIFAAKGLKGPSR